MVVYVSVGDTESKRKQSRKGVVEIMGRAVMSVCWFPGSIVNCSIAWLATSNEQTNKHEEEESRRVMNDSRQFSHVRMRETTTTRKNRIY